MVNTDTNRAKEMVRYEITTTKKKNEKNPMLIQKKKKWFLNVTLECVFFGFTILHISG